MASLFEVYEKNGTLEEIKCDICNNITDLYLVDYIPMCKVCMKNEEYEEEEYGLSDSERNS